MLPNLHDVQTLSFKISSEYTKYIENIDPF